ncbi:hypothetical protein [Oceanispirochaeta sp.]|jgi:hypothetical protein|uniref:hypothetical protein n=1 Tax=Oceanispirochaeta sp. TaxID=2035350 RepID=UPI00262097DD|nr:hypothetical protein [Oceanispirochaeta sp.]MDA3956717.1 hypothetical protein [Oceanispirochaeta sp.]
MPPVEVVLTFSPQASGDLETTVSVLVDGITDPFVLPLTGEGNYAPTVKFGIQVTGAGTADANGFYERDGFHTSNSETRPLYTKAGSVNFYCYIHPWDGDVWGIDNTLTAGGSNPDPQYAQHTYPSTMVPPETGWLDNSADDIPPSLTIYDIKGTNAQV